MNPVVGLDIAKGESQVQAFLDKKKPYKHSFKILHNVNGLHDLHQFLVEVERLTLKKSAVVLESTGHYQAPIVQFLDDHNYLYIMVNPLISHRAKSSSLRKVKTDAIDAHHLCELYYKEDLEPYKKRGVQLLNLRHLTRQQASLSGITLKPSYNSKPYLIKYFLSTVGCLVIYILRFLFLLYRSFQLQKQF